MKRLILFLLMSAVFSGCIKTESIQPGTDTPSDTNQQRLKTIVTNSNTITVYILRFMDGYKLDQIEIQGGKTSMFTDSNFIFINGSYYNLDSLIKYEHRTNPDTLYLYFG